MIYSKNIKATMEHFKAPALQAFDAPGARGVIVPHTPEGDAVMRGLLDGLCGPPRIVKGDPRKASYWAGASEFAKAVRA